MSRNRSGKVSGLGNIIEGVIKKLKKKGLGEEELAAAWKSAAGEKAAGHTRPVAFRRSTLIVNVDDSGWLYELTTKKRNLISRLEGDFKGKKLRDIRFRIGEIRQG